MVANREDRVLTHICLARNPVHFLSAGLPQIRVLCDLPASLVVNGCWFLRFTFIYY